MDWKLVATTFVAIFIAELGDKTQLATLSLSASGSRWAVFTGSALALVASSAVAVLGGEVVTKFVSPAVLRRVAGAVFVVLGVVYLVKRES
ncbi:MAG: TMEM165/GDT1 family protein [Polyangiaceae bacterium]